MINPALLNKLTIARATDNGVYLEDEDHNEVLLPNRYVPENYSLGDTIEVFIYFDSEDRMVATTDTPKIMLGQVNSLKVVDTTRIGAFLDWGLPKDLFVPFKNQLNEMQRGEYYPVTIYIDQVTGRIVATSKLGRIVNNDEISVVARQKVSIIVAQRRERGFRVIIDQHHWGMLYDNQIFREIHIGELLTAWVLKIAEDGRIDVCLQQQGYDAVCVAVDALVQLMQENGGALPLGDKSDPAKIQLITGMSKKVFKRAAGVLLREGKAEINGNETKLKKS
ncbi:MAG: S1-like domain-containing RNA-binding protein [Mucinivorans sp.]